MKRFLACLFAAASAVTPVAAEPPAEPPAERFQRFLGESTKAFQTLGMYSAGGPTYEIKDSDQMGNLTPPAARPPRARPGSGNGAKDANQRPPLRRPHEPYYKDQDQQEQGEDRCPARPSPAAPVAPTAPYPYKDADQMPLTPPPADTSKNADQRRPTTPCPAPPPAAPPTNSSKDADQRPTPPSPPPSGSKGQGF